MDLPAYEDFEDEPEDEHDMMELYYFVILYAYALSQVWSYPHQSEF